MRALAIINLSTLDDFTNEFGEDKGAEFAHKLFQEISNFDGDVYIIDQNKMASRNSGPRMALKRSLLRLMLKKDIHLVPFNENQIEWKYFLKDFLGELLHDGVDELVLGGLWYDPQFETGAVSDAFNYIGQVIPTAVLEKISAQMPSGRRR